MTDFITQIDKCGTDDSNIIEYFASSLSDYLILSTVCLTLKCKQSEVIHCHDSYMVTSFHYAVVSFHSVIHFQ